MRAGAAPDVCLAPGSPSVRPANLGGAVPGDLGGGPVASSGSAVDTSDSGVAPAGCGRALPAIRRQEQRGEDSAAGGERRRTARVERSHDRDS
ncbi:MAG TPA: hypothetical protein VMF65_15965 [Acidimicrobiales bacterium]|nr:hypothetical protein [Acidimicrobiales bacterium]